MAFGIRSAPARKEEEVALDLTPLGASPPPVAEEPAEPPRSSRIFLEPEEEVRPRIRLRQKPRPTLLLALAYALGGLAPAVLSQGRRRFAWAFLALLSMASWAAIVWWRNELNLWIEGGRLPLLPCIVVVVTVTLVGIASWSRAVRLAGKDLRFVPERLPKLFRHPLSVGILGALLPGAGLLIAGHSRRAAAAVWLMGPLSLSALALWRADWLWDCNRASGAQGLPLLALEIVFLSAMASALVCGLLWAGSILDGSRLSAFRSGQKASARADWLGFGLMVATVAFFATLGPANLARNLDHFASVMRHDEYKLIPLGMERLAMRLDASQPRYVMHAAELHDLLDQHESAHALREGLRERWQEYAELVLHEEVEPESAARPQPFVGTGEWVAPAKP